MTVALKIIGYLNSELFLILNTWVISYIIGYILKKLHLHLDQEKLFETYVGWRKFDPQIEC